MLCKRLIMFSCSSSGEGTGSSGIEKDGLVMMELLGWSEV